MNAKLIGGLQLISGLALLWMQWGNWDLVLAGLTFVLMGVHHFMEK